MRLHLLTMILIGHHETSLYNNDFDWSSWD